MDRRYTTGIFTWPSHFNFDLRDTNSTKYTYDLEDYLKRNLPGFIGFDRYELYLDEVPTNADWLRALRVKTEIAYVKIIEDVRNSPILAVYRRKDRDLRSVPGKMKKIPLSGYSIPAEFTQPDRITSLWVSYQNENSFKIKKCTGRLVIEGVNNNGEPIYYETIIKDQNSKKPE